MRIPNPFSILYRHRDLVVQFTQRELQLRHRGSRLGHVWALLAPLSMMGLYLFVFGFITKSRFGRLNETTFDFALGLLLSMSLFHVVAETIGAAPMLITNQPNFVKKVVFPLEVIPFSSVASSVYHAALGMLLVIIAAALSPSGVAWTGALLLPLLLLPLALMALGVAWGLSALGVFVRDISHMTAFLSTAIMFGSAVFYAPPRSDPLIWAFLKFNPLLHVIEEARKLVLWHEPLNWTAVGYIYLVALLVVGIGYLLFALLRPYFAEVI
jgi:lipopolysaccharide transport system permease protein